MCFNGFDPELAALLAGDVLEEDATKADRRAEGLLALVTLSLLAGIASVVLLTGGLLG